MATNKKVIKEIRYTVQSEVRFAMICMGRGAIERQLVNCATRLVRCLDCASTHTNHCKSHFRLYRIFLITFLFVAIGR